MWTWHLRDTMPDWAICGLRSRFPNARYFQVLYPLRINMHFAMMLAPQSIDQFNNCSFGATAFVKIRR